MKTPAVHPTAESIAAQVESGDVIYVNGGLNYPMGFITALVDRADELEGVVIMHPMRVALPPEETDYVAVRNSESFIHVSDFVSDERVRSAIADGRAAFRPNHIGDAARSYRGEHIDWAVSQARPPENGRFNLGAFQGSFQDFLPKARNTVLEINSYQPAVGGDNWVDAADVDATFDRAEPLVAYPSGSSADDVETAIARHVAGLIDDGSTLQMGIGALPGAVASELGEKNDLGVHTELLSDPLMQLIRSGVATGARKSIDRGLAVFSIALGSEELYEFINDNPGVESRRISDVNDPFTISQNYRQIAINATLEVDLMGQASSESIGSRHYSGTGGQWEFSFGANRSPGGKSIVVLRSTAKRGTLSTIRATLAPGSAVSIPRNDASYVVSEFGVADLRGRSLQDRARALIEIAHPDFRDELADQAKDIGYIGRRRGPSR